MWNIRSLDEAKASHGRVAQMVEHPAHNRYCCGFNSCRAHQWGMVDSLMITSSAKSAAVGIPCPRWDPARNRVRVLKGPCISPRSWVRRRINAVGAV